MTMNSPTSAAAVVVCPKETRATSNLGKEETKEDCQVDHYDPTARSCGWCYAVLLLPSSETIHCPDCPRIYCSPQCCATNQATHSFWCGKAGEKGVDFDLCELPLKGLGVVTRRVFQRGEQILAERPVWTTTDQSLQESDHNVRTRTAAMALTPTHNSASLEDKIQANRVSVAQSPRDKTCGLFLTFSRVNHDCVGNSDHYFDGQHGVQVLVANTEIEAGTEITFPYTRTGPRRQEELQWRGFACACRACDEDEEDDWGRKVNQLVELEKDINSLNGQSQDAHRDQAVQSAQTMLRLYEELGVSDREFARTHYDLFQILVLREKSLEQAKEHITKAYQHALRFCGYQEHETVQHFHYYQKNPELHGNYRAID